MIVLNLSNFSINNVIEISDMFSGCSSLEELNVSNFNTNKVGKTKDLIDEKISLLISFINDCLKNAGGDDDSEQCLIKSEFNLSNFNINNVKYMDSMFSGCSEQFQKKIKAEYKIIKGEAFTNY